MFCIENKIIAIRSIESPRSAYVLRSTRWPTASNKTKRATGNVHPSLFICGNGAVRTHVSPAGTNFPIHRSRNHVPESNRGYRRLLSLLSYISMSNVGKGLTPLHGKQCRTLTSIDWIEQSATPVSSVYLPPPHYNFWESL